MPGVARLGDTLTHGATITSASTLHTVNGRGVARVGDTVSCPTHGNQTIVNVSTTVKTDGRLIAHVGATASCGAVITQGSNDTFVGNTTSAVSAYQDVPGESGNEIIQYEEQELYAVGVEDEVTGGPLRNDEVDGTDVSATEIDETPPPPMAAVAKNCKGIAENTPDTYMLSSRFSLANLSSQASEAQRGGAQSGPVVAQNGLSRAQIICNLKSLSENCLEPIATQFGRSSFRIGSGFRRGSGPSQHLVGQAADLHFFEPGTSTRVSRSRLKEIATWIRDNVPYYQLLLEFYGSPHGWVHIGLRPNTASRHPSMPVASAYSGSGGLKPGLRIP